MITYALIISFAHLVRQCKSQNVLTFTTTLKMLGQTECVNNHCFRKKNNYCDGVINKYILALVIGFRNEASLPGETWPTFEFEFQKSY